METLMQLLAGLKAMLDGFNPALWPCVVVAALWVAQWAVRRWAPGVWEKMADLPFRNELTEFDKRMRKVWQAIPSAVMGAVLFGLAGGGDIVDAAVGAVFALLAPIFHELLKKLPIPYRGGTPPAADKDAS